MSIFKSKLLIRIISLIMTVLSVIGTPNHTLIDVFKASADGWFLTYTAEERAEMISDLLLANKKESFDSDTAELAKDIIYAVVIQFATGDADPDAITDVLAKLPHKDKVRDEIKDYEGALSIETAEKLTSIFPEPIHGFLRELAIGIFDLYVYFEKTEHEGIYEFKGSYVDGEGNIHHAHTGVYYDSETGIIYGKNNDGIFSIGYDFDAKQYTLQNPVYCWMRNMGYNIGYDIMGSLLFMDTNTVRVKFNACGRDWMIQLWKGNYTVLSNGAEIGMYYREEGKRLSYTCIEDEHMPVMEMSLYNGDDKILSRSPVTHWWLSGFQIGPTVDHEDMTLNAKLTFNNAEMSEAFASALDKKGITPTVEENFVSFSWK
ncbi:MAG: DUF4474 domain-containing protein [Clostridia bacterium]|nr:DUF4474 domain-containing protein [Clostridia bacterium]